MGIVSYELRKSVQYHLVSLYQMILQYQYHRQQEWLEKISKTSSREALVLELQGLEKTEDFNHWGGGWLAFKLLFFPFFNRENYIIKNIWVYSKSKIKTKVTSKQNLEHFKMINRRLFIHELKCCCHPPGQYLLECLCFPLHQGPSFICLSTFVFRFY